MLLVVYHAITVVRLKIMMLSGSRRVTIGVILYIPGCPFLTQSEAAKFLAFDIDLAIIKPPVLLATLLALLFCPPHKNELPMCLRSGQTLTGLAKLAIARST